MVKLILIDSGTTNTRLRLTEDGNVLQTLRFESGAKDGHDAVKAAIGHLLSACSDFPASAAVFSGMVTSATGLVEIPHVEGPLDLLNLPVVRHDFPELSVLPMYFIPGIRLGSYGDPIGEGDIIRGEETEMAGYLAEHGTSKTRLFLHLGSHHKAMLVRQSRLTASATSMTGEVFSSIIGHTILASSLSLDDPFDSGWFLRGATHTETYGLARTLFLVRIMDIREHLSAGARMGFALGALARDCLTSIRKIITPDIDECILYGQPAFAEAYRILLRQDYPSLSVSVLSSEQTDELAPAGAWILYKNGKKS